MDKVIFSPPLSENAAGNVNSLVKMVTCLIFRNFRLFLDSDVPYPHVTDRFKLLTERKQESYHESLPKRGVIG